MILNAFLLFVSLVSPNTLQITVEGIEKEQGFIRVAFYNSEEIHLDEKTVSYYHEEPVNSVGSMSFDVPIPEGDYSVAIYHDVNSDKELNKSMIGIPKEPYGFSNNVMGMFGPPSFDEAKISFPEVKKITISLR
ncbi:DUF2141 domain-containing protein [Marinoscillum pacificum]|uniref:DUF2141 domain-containing protein n=1 Tax=Marinoscillum pacificum TaxID=392723 RepID=UPI002157A0E9|nr:DUF2141 domain-containing protein [Marinoscillum pacificum]